VFVAFTDFDYPDVVTDRLNRIKAMYAFLGDDDYIPDKRTSLLRFGKRGGSLLRFGKRSSILRFGKRPYFNPYFAFPDAPEESFGALADTADAEGAEKRSSLFRFGKRSEESHMKDYERSDNEKKPHTPWRFGREEFADYSEDKAWTQFA